MAKAKKGDLVKVHYSGSLKDGYVFDSSYGKAPLEVKLGIGSLIEGFEAAIIGMKKGEKKTVRIPQEKAYGPYRTDYLVEIDKSQIPENNMPQVGMKLQLKAPSGQMTNVIVTEIKENKITLDANHPLAGKELTFEIELVDILQGV